MKIWLISFILVVSLFIVSTNLAFGFVPDTIKLNEKAFGIDVNPQTDLIYLTKYPHWVSVYNATTNELLTEIKVQGTPSGIKVNPNNNKIYVTYFGGHGITVIDGLTNKIIRTIDTRATNVVSINNETNIVYAIDNLLRFPKFSVIDGESNQKISEMDLDFIPSSTTVNTVDHLVYIAGNYPSNSINVFDEQTNKFIEKINLQIIPHDIIFNPNTKMIYLSDGRSITVFDVPSNHFLTIDWEMHPSYFNLNPVTNLIYVTGSSELVAVINGTDNKIIDTIQVGHRPSKPAIDPTNNKIYIVNRESNSISVIDGTTNNVELSIQSFSYEFTIVVIILIISGFAILLMKIPLKRSPMPYKNRWKLPELYLTISAIGLLAVGGMEISIFELIRSPIASSSGNGPGEALVFPAILFALFSLFTSFLTISGALLLLSRRYSLGLGLSFGSFVCSIPIALVIIFVSYELGLLVLAILIGILVLLSKGKNFTKQDKKEKLA